MSKKEFINTQWNLNSLSDDEAKAFTQIQIIPIRNLWNTTRDPIMSVRKM